MDAESEHLVQEAIDRAMKGRTVLIIAHRLSTVRDASQVYTKFNNNIIVNKGLWGSISKPLLSMIIALFNACLFTVKIHTTFAPKDILLFVNLGYTLYL